MSKEADEKIIRKFISYYDDDNEIKEGYFDVISEDVNTIKFKTEGGNIVKYPWHRILKVKEKVDGI